MTTLLANAASPNLVQTLEGTPVLVHAGPFANIAHGCSSVIATRAALGLSDYVITEAGFGADLGAEKFVHLKCRQAGLSPAAAVVVAGCGMLRYHGGAENLDDADAQAVRRGLPNLRVHVENLARMGLPAVVALNRHPGDGDDEIAVVREACEQMGVGFAVCDAYARGGEGALDLARRVQELADTSADSDAAPRFLYDEQAPLRDKVEALTTQVYRADGVDYDPAAAEALDRLQDEGRGGLGVCMAKTQYSLSDRKSARNVPEGYRLRVREVELRGGAGFVVVKTGKILTMPGMPREPNALNIHLGVDGQVHGLF
jgi:formate--tetrahydrofolate ligase